MQYLKGRVYNNYFAVKLRKIVNTGKIFRNVDRVVTYKHKVQDTKSDLKTTN